MLKLSLALTTFVLALALPAAYAFTSRPGPRIIARTLLEQVNSGPDGHITRRVTCARAAKARRTFDCSLESVVSTQLGAHVALVDGGLRTTWDPIAG
jgi:hypothetical protein